jgi:hypothetical protein
MKLFVATKVLSAVALVAGSDLAFSQTTLNANVGPSNNGGATAWAIYFDVTTAASGVTITEMTSANTGTAGAAFTVEVFTFNGSGLGGPVTAGPGSSPAGWTSLGTAPATQGATASGVSLPIDIPDIALTANQVTGIAVLFTGVGPRYFGTGAPPYGMYTDGTLSLTTGDSRSAPFTATGSFFTSRELVGSLTYTTNGGGGSSVVFCPGDGSGTACPCGNNSTLGAGEGCLSSLGMGAKIDTTGNPSIAADTLVLHGSQMPNSSALYFQGTTQVSAGLGGVFGDGLRCAGGSVTRLKTTTNVAGVSQYPVAGDPSISVKGNVTAPGTRTYQVWYRNAASFCTPSTFNLSNGLQVMWNP